MESPSAPTGSVAAGSSGQEAIRLYDTERHQPLGSLAGDGTRYFPAFDSTGDILGAINGEGKVRLWRAPPWAEIEAAETAANQAGRR